jgi:hypothetical protein
MKRDSRPVSQQVLSGLKIGAVVVAIGAGVGAGVLIGPSYIPVHRIRTYIWHLRHGNTIDVGQYRLPAPTQWFVERNSQTDVLMFDLNTGDSISAQKSDLLKGRTLSEWSEWVSRALATSQTMKKTGQRDYHINGETFRCIEQDFDTNLKVGHLYSIHCLSDGGLEVDFQAGLGVGREHDAAFYSLLQRIQRL